jgi:phage terminase Nu1 subunit (DNA packaging protein)
MLTTPLYPVGTVAKLFNLSERRVQQLASQGVIPKPEKGQYNLLAAMRGYVLFLQQRGERQPLARSESAALERMRLRLMTAQVDRLEHDNQVLHAEWIEASVVREAFQEVGATFTACVDALPGRLAFELTNIADSAVVKAKLFAACRELRHVTGEKLHVLGETMRTRTASGREPASPATADTGCVGG